MKKLFLMIVLTAIHYSALGDYLIDQNGNRVVIQGHPYMVCYVGKTEEKEEKEEIHGTFVKAKGAFIWVHGWSIMSEGKIYTFGIPNPVCDVK